MTTQKRTVYIIAGPTAVGKSVIANYLARRIHGEIVNCDSIQLYKYLDIGSAKPSPADMSTVPQRTVYIIAAPSVRRHRSERGYDGGAVSENGTGDHR